ncbi:protein GPR108 [Anguilla anguilla]|uniref:protein GPR108 n=1 Tax=Anguilla anguilla TaxID=7936 RepID=UPI0015B1957D|nr:protein GPR108 [Anguilla anguilla]
MAMYQDVCFSVFVAALLFGICDSRIHHLVLKNETRFIIHLNTFGFYAKGTLDVNLKALNLRRDQKIDFSKYPMGFSLSKSRVNGLLAYTAEDTEECQLTKTKSEQPLILFLIDIDKLSVSVRSFGEQDSLLSETPKAKEEDAEIPEKKEKRDLTSDQSKTTVGKDTEEKGTKAEMSQKDKEEKRDPSKTTVGKITEEKPNEEEVDEKDEEKQDQPLEEEKSVTEKPAKSEGKIDGRTLALQKIGDSYNFSFHITIGSLAEGLYSLNFHSCYNLVPGVSNPYNLNVEVIEQNPGGYLSAAEIPLPLLFISMAIVFFVAAMVWVYTLMQHRYSVFKIHWLMAALAFTKSISLVFHSINYHFINKEGRPIEGWAVMYYITHLLKGALLFITLALIGTGWAFVKYILSDKEKKIFMIVIPLQVLANVAYIIIESTEEGSSEYALWKEVLFLVDLICCGAILFPVVWSIRHLQDASSTDGKAAMNLEKLKLFRHYYVMIVCYIYFTRIIAFLLKVAIPFQWQWFYEFLVEISTLIFFVMTGYKFRPASNNPYLQLPLDEEDVEMDEVVTESGALEGISRVKKTQNGRDRQREPSL